MTAGQRRQLFAFAGLLLALIGLTAAWRWSPLDAWLAPSNGVAQLRAWGQAAGPMLAVPLLTAALVLAVPLSVLTLMSMAALGPWWGSACLVSAALLAATVSQILGRHLGHDLLLHWAGPKVLHVSESLAARGLLAVVAIRLVPIAPFAIVNMVIGTTHLRLRDMLLGTLIGVMPLTVTMAVFTDWFVGRLGA